MDEDWRNAFGILMSAAICDCAGAGYAMARHRLALVTFYVFFFSFILKFWLHLLTDFIFDILVNCSIRLFHCDTYP